MEANDNDKAEAASEVAPVTSESSASANAASVPDNHEDLMASSLASGSSGVTLETLSEAGEGPSEAVVPGTNGGQHHHPIHHPLMTPTSPRSVTTTSMSASGKMIF